MQEQHISLTAAEWRVMECLWELAPCTGREAITWLQEKMGWSRSTTLTLLRRLTDKGAAAADNDGELMTFRPLVQREEAAVQETAYFLDRVYQGSLSLMLSALTKKQAISQDELAELYAILREMEGKSDA